MFFFIIYIGIVVVYGSPCVSLVSASTLKDWYSCKNQYLYMIERQVVKPKEVIVVISNSNNEYNTTHRGNGNTTVNLYFRKGRHNQADNRNYGIYRSTCEIVSIFDIDDFLSKYGIEEVIKIFTSIPGVDMVLHTYVEQRAMLDTEEFDANNITQYILPYNYSFIYSEYYKNRNHKLKHCCYYFDKDLPIQNAWLSTKREILMTNKYDSDWKWYRKEDSELLKRLILKHYNLLLMSYPFGHYMQKGECYL